MTYIPSSSSPSFFCSPPLTTGGWPSFNLRRCQQAETLSAARHVTPVPRWWADRGWGGFREERGRRREERSGASACDGRRWCDFLTRGSRDGNCHLRESHFGGVRTAVNRLILGLHSMQAVSPCCSLSLVMHCGCGLL